MIMKSTQMQCLSTLLDDYGWREIDVADGEPERLIVGTGRVYLTVWHGLVSLHFPDPFGHDEASVSFSGGWSYGTVVHLAVQADLLDSLRRVHTSGEGD